MLVLSRKKDQKIHITHPAVGTITVMVVEIRGDKVRLGIDAPPEVTIHREEVAAAIEREKAKPPSIEAIEGMPPTIL